MRIAALVLFATFVLQEPTVLERARRLVEQLRSEDIETREKATKALLELGEGVMPALEEAAKDRDSEVSKRAQFVIRRFQQARRVEQLLASDLGEVLRAEPAVLEVLKKGTPDERGQMVRRIGGHVRAGFGVTESPDKDRIKVPHDLRAKLMLEFLMAGLADLGREEALYTLYVLNRYFVERGVKPVLWQCGADELGDLVRRTGAEGPIDRVMATTALSSAAGSAAEERLVELTDDGHACVRYVALRGLQARMAVGRGDVVAGKVADADRYCSNAALEILGYFGGPKAEALLRDAIQSGKRDPFNYQKAIACWSAGRLKLPVERELIPLLESGFTDVHRRAELTCALKALAIVGSDEAIPTLVSALEWTSDRSELLRERTLMRRDAYTALARKNSRKSVEPLRKLLSSKDLEARSAAAALLIRAGEKLDEGVLLDLLKEDTAFRPHLLVSLARVERASVPVVSPAWKLLNWCYATGVTNTVASTDKGVQLPFLYWYERTDPVATIAGEAAKAGGFEIALPKEKGDPAPAVKLETPFTDPTVEEVMVALALQRWVPIRDRDALKLVPIEEALEHWRGRLKRDK